MNTHNRIASIVCLAAMIWSSSSNAVQVGIDSFSVSGTNSTGTFSFTDSFNNGSPPPCGPADCASQPTFYGVNSINPLPTESGGFLQLDSSNGILTANALEQARRTESVTVAGAKSELLSSGGAITMAGVFTLPVLSGPLNEGYGIRFVDALPGSGPGDNQEILQLSVQWWTGDSTNSAGWYIRYLVQDFVNNTITTIDADLVNIPLNDNEICLSLGRAQGSDQFTASYGYGTGGSCTGGMTSLGSTAGFLYADYVRSQLFAFETVTVPEPNTVLLIAGGVVLISIARKRRNLAGAI